MTTPVDLNNLRSMTDGDVEMEKILFEEFYFSFNNGIIKLWANSGESSKETWRKEAHALKGMALNLGAEALGALCMEAQEQYMANSDFKESLLTKIRDQYQQVKMFLAQL